MCRKGIEFVSVSDGVKDDVLRFRKFQQFSDALLAMRPVFEDLLITSQVPMLHSPLKKSSQKQKQKKQNIYLSIRIGNPRSTHPRICRYKFAKKLSYAHPMNDAWLRNQPTNHN